MPQCLGRIVRDAPKGIHMLSFEEGGLFHLPLRCETIARGGDLCDKCYEREEKTIEKIREINNKTSISGPHPTYLHGRVTEPIPFWSRIYDGAWFRLKIQEGCSMSEETMVKVREAVKKAYEDVKTVDPQPLPVKKGGRKPKVPAPPAPPAAPVVTGVPAPPPSVAPIAVASVIPEIKASVPVKKSAAPSRPVAKIVTTKQLEVANVVKIKVRKYELDGRMFYLDPIKDKLYDMKFKYVGRLKDDTLLDFPDSDAECP